MSGTKLVVAALCLLLAMSGSALAQAMADERQDSGTPVVCDPLHPAHFTYISERRGDDKPHALFGAEKVDGGVEGQDDGRLQPVHCTQPLETLTTRGRWSVSERGEIVISFMPSAVLPHVGHLGRLDVEGQIVSGTNARAIEIPGYREIGKAVPSPREQASETESVIADVAVFLDAAERVGEAKARFKDGTPDGGASTSTENKGPGRGLIDPQAPVRPRGQSPEYWVFTHMFRSPGQYERITRNILEHSAAFALDTNSLAVSDILRRLVLVAQLGQQVLARREELTNGMAERAAFNDVEFDKGRWVKTVRLHSRVGNRIQTNDWKLPADIGNNFCTSFVEMPYACEEREFAAECNAVLELHGLFCGTPIPIPNEGFDLAKQKSQIEGLLKKINDEGIFSKFDARLVRQRQYYRSLDSSALYDAYADLKARMGDGEGVDGISHIPYLTPLADEFDQIASVLGDTKTVAKQNVVRVLRKQLSQISASGWREIRLQPKAIGAREGDTIELTITYFPSRASAVEVTEEAGSVLQSTTGATRPARWTVRFLVDRIGFYVNAGPRLSLVSTLDYAPEAENFRGAQGNLVPGLGVDLLWYKDGVENGLPILAGAGFRVDYLDFDARQTIELGLEAHVLLLRGVVSLGVGYNVSTQSPRLSGRSTYLSLGLGVEQMLDEALKLARQSDR